MLLRAWDAASGRLIRFRPAADRPVGGAGCQRQRPRNPDYEISVQDIANWESANGQIPLGAVVMARTGWGARWNSVSRYRNTDAKGSMHFPGYSEDAARFLAEGRNALRLGIDTPNLDHGRPKYWR